MLHSKYNAFILIKIGSFVENIMVQLITTKVLVIRLQANLATHVGGHSVTVHCHFEILCHF